MSAFLGSGGCSCVRHNPEIRVQGPLCTCIENGVDNSYTFALENWDKESCAHAWNVWIDNSYRFVLENRDKESCVYPWEDKFLRLFTNPSSYRAWDLAQILHHIDPEILCTCIFKFRPWACTWKEFRYSENKLQSWEVRDLVHIRHKVEIWGTYTCRRSWRRGALSGDFWV